MNERDDSLIKDVIQSATPDLRAVVRERALEAMAAPRLLQRGLRFVPNAVGGALVMAALLSTPFLPVEPPGGPQVAMAAEQMLAEADRADLPAAPQTRKESQREELPEPMRWYAAKAPEFVRNHHPNDPQMLIAAGLLTRDVREAESLLKAAIAKGGAGAAWAAYATVLMETGPAYARPANWAADPTDPKSMAEVKEELARSGLPDSLTEAQGAPVLEALKRWEGLEPGNAYPVAMEVHYLYGLHRDQEALERWEQASRMAEADLHAQDYLNGATRLLQALGASGWYAISAAYGGGAPYLPYGRIRDGARIGGYEGRLAVAEGRPDDAVRWWMATIRLGRLMQESGPTLIECLVGIAVEGIGGAPAWLWQPDRMTGIPGGPLLKARLYHGPHHDLFVRQVGPLADQQARDSLVRAKLRSMLARRYAERLGALSGPMLRIMALRTAAAVTGAIVVALLVVFIGVSAFARRKADSATMLSWTGRAALMGAGLVPLGTGLVLLWLMMVWIASSASRASAAAGTATFACMGAALLIWLVAPLIAAFWTRRPDAKLITAWRGNIRRVIPLALVSCAALSLALGLASRRVENVYVRQCLSESEMSRVVRDIGPEWQNPKVPPDSWRAEPPPIAGNR